MSDYIKLGAVGAALYKARCAGKISPEQYGAAMLILSELETETDIAPIRRTTYKYFNGFDTPRCVNCRYALSLEWAYCPECGALIDYDTPESGDKVE